MKRIEEIIGEKILQLAHYILSKAVKPDITIDTVTQLTTEEIEKIKQKYGIEGIILDVDETIRKDMKDIPQCNQDWIEAIKGKLKIIILSNGIDKDIEKYFSEKGIEYIGFAHKPLKKNFIKACNKMNVIPEKVLVVGDSLFDDIYGGKRNNMKTVLVKSVKENESKSFKEYDVESVKENEAKSFKVYDVESAKENEVKSFKEYEVESVKENEIKSSKEYDVKLKKENKIKSGKKDEIKSIEEEER